MVPAAAVKGSGLRVGIAGSPGGEGGPFVFRMWAGAGVDAVEPGERQSKLGGCLRVFGPLAGLDSGADMRVQLAGHVPELLVHDGFGLCRAGRERYARGQRQMRARRLTAAVPAAPALAPRAAEWGCVFVEKVAQQAQFQRFGDGGFGGLMVWHVGLLSVFWQFAKLGGRGRGADATSSC
ncbi:hypothetical protein DMY87_06545 [Rhizobium wuzhouense]|uniref:Uncharacterized protein n=1 Tax=Rhizobium wuzhouense TaxID=1986026 RepID=A0ABX5NT01_9HYPH|nr:hypothetical protein DMY87_06545 [Rhizobium wuzhouense]